MRPKNRDLRRVLLKPFKTPRQSSAYRKSLVAALSRLDNRALAEDILLQLRQVVAEAPRRRGQPRFADEEFARKWVALALALYEARRISTQEFIFYASSWIEGVHESRVLEGRYDHDLEPISASLERIKREAGLHPDEDWLVGEGPTEYRRLTKKYDVILRRHFVATLREFGLQDLARRQDLSPDEFERSRERGRRSVFHRDELRAAIKDIVLRHESEAQKAAATAAFGAAVTSLGAGLEGLLLLRCLRSRQKAQDIAKNLPKPKRPRNAEDPTTWGFETLIEVCFQAGWLPPVTTPVARYSPAGLAHLLRVMRNHIHPGRQAREEPWLEPDERDYDDAEAIYVILLSTLGNIGIKACGKAPISG